MPGWGDEGERFRQVVGGMCGDPKGLAPPGPGRRGTDATYASVGAFSIQRVTTAYLTSQRMTRPTMVKRSGSLWRRVAP